MKKLVRIFIAWFMAFAVSVTMVFNSFTANAAVLPVATGVGYDVLIALLAAMGITVSADKTANGEYTEATKTNLDRLRELASGEAALYLTTNYLNVSDEVRRALAILEAADKLGFDDDDTILPEWAKAAGLTLNDFLNNPLAFPTDYIMNLAAAITDEYPQADVDLNGYGCMIIEHENNDTWITSYYGNGGIISRYNEGISFDFYLPWQTRQINFRGDILITEGPSSIASTFVYADVGKTTGIWFELIGTWYNSDGTVSEVSTATETQTDVVVGDIPATVGDNPITTVDTDNDGIPDVVYPPTINNITDYTDNSTTIGDTIINQITESGTVAIGIEALDNLTLPAAIASVFPFCLPFDFIRGIQLMSAHPVAPHFRIPFTLPDFGLFHGETHYVEVDLQKYSGAFKVVREVQLLLFALALVFLSFRIVKGVN